MAPRTRRSTTKEQNASSEALFRVLVTGSNAGLGYDTCRRVIDEFLASRPPTHRLHLIVTTRSTTKSTATISRLSKHIRKTHNFEPGYDTAPPGANDDGPETVGPRVLLTSEEFDLTELPSVIRAARRLRRAVPTLDALICNAGVACWLGINWPLALWSTTTDFVQATTWPSHYVLNDIGVKTKLQLKREKSQGAGAQASGGGSSSSSNSNDKNKKTGRGQAKDSDSDSSEVEEPALGQVFCANVFGHYILAHELGPLLSSARPSPGRIVWVSSIEAERAGLIWSDLQSLDGGKAYISSKRLTDLLALSSGQPSTRSLTRSFLSDPSHASYKPLSPQPRQYLCHPGVVSTDILQLNPIAAWMKRQSFYIARWLGSPWHVISGYKGAVAPAWLALAPQATLDTLEEREGVGKWGSACDAWGRERVRRTEVEGWGWGGRVEGEVLDASGRRERRTGRKRGAKDVTERELEDFDKDGVAAWRELEKLREDWYELMEDAGVIDEEDDE